MNPYTPIRHHDNIIRKPDHKSFCRDATEKRAGPNAGRKGWERGRRSHFSFVPTLLYLAPPWSSINHAGVWPLHAAGGRRGQAKNCSGNKTPGGSLKIHSWFYCATSHDLRQSVVVQSKCSLNTKIYVIKTIQHTTTNNIHMIVLYLCFDNVYTQIFHVHACCRWRESQCLPHNSPFTKYQRHECCTLEYTAKISKLWLENPIEYLFLLLNWDFQSMKVRILLRNV